MHAITFTTLALTTSFFSSIAAAPTKSYNSTVPSNSTSPYNSTAASSRYTQVADYNYPNFFDGFTAFNATDPTYGFVEYVSAETAQAENMTGWIFNQDTNTSTAFIGVDATGIATSGRSSVRLTSNQIFTVGTLAVFDVRHVPVGCGPGGSGLWPAVWLLAPQPTWPYGGEIDVIEYVNPSADGSGTYNSMTLHTGPGCVVDTFTSNSQGDMQGLNCSFSADGNLGDDGCSIPASPSYTLANGKPVATAGEAFNAQGGGVYILEWTTKGISIWLFPHHSLPADVHAGRPNPRAWKQKPLAKFSGSGCDFGTAFAPQQIIVNVDICGSWAGNVYPGGMEACNAFAANNPAAYKDAYFEFGGIQVFSSS